MKKTLVGFALAAGLAPALLAQQVTPVWVQHLNGLVNVDPADKLPVIVKNVGAPYAANGIGRSQQFALGKLRRYDSTRFLLMVKENGIDEADANLSQELRDRAAAYPDRSLIWIDAATGKPLGIAHEFGLRPITATGQANNNDFFSNWDLDEGPAGTQALYSTHKNVILRWAPKAGGGWESTPTCAWVEPTPDAVDCQGNPLDGSSGGDGYSSWRWRDFRVMGSGVNTRLLGGGGTWRASMHVQVFATTDGLKFYPIARFNDRDGGRKGSYSQGGLSSRVVQYGLDSAHPNLMTAYHGRYPGTGWEARPSRFVLDPDNVDPAYLEPDTYNPLGVVALVQVNNEAWGNLPAFQWESAGANGLSITHATDGVNHYDGNWGGIMDAHKDVDYVINYAFPSWNNQFGSIKKPGWIGVHRLDGSIAQNAAYKLPFTEMDVQSNDAGAQTGNDFGYDGDVLIYPDLEAPANLDRSTVVWVGSGYGFGVFTVQNVAPTIVTEPQDASLTENSGFTLTAEISGSPNRYQWYKDNVALDGTKTLEDGSAYYPPSVLQGVNKPILVVKKAAVTDSGKYKLVAVNPLGTVTTREATVTVVADAERPTIASFKNARSADASYVRIEFSEEVTADSAGDANNYRINGVAATAARAVGTKAAMVYIPHLADGSTTTMNVSGVRDIAAGGGNQILPNTAIQLKAPAQTAGYLLWEQYTDMVGTAVEILETDPNYPSMPARWEYMTVFNTDANGLSQVGDNFGGRISGWITPTESAAYRFFIRSDDASKLLLSTSADPGAAVMIAWENGCCQAFLEPAGVDPAGNLSLQTSEPVTLNANTSYYIALLYKEGAGGDWAQVAWRKEGDSTPAGSLTPIPGTLFKAYRAVYEPPVLAKPVVSGGVVSISWTGGGKLQESTNLQSWSDVSGNPASPYQTPLPTSAGQKFYRVVQ